MPTQGNGSANANESTPLISSERVAQAQEHAQQHLNNVWKYEEDDRAWVKWPVHVLRMMWVTLASNYVNILLVFVPLGIISGALGWNPTATFILNFAAIIPLAALLAFATEELSHKLGQTIGGLLNATFGNAVELIVSVIDMEGD